METLRSIFSAVGCEGTLLAVREAGSATVELAADQPVIAASVIKVLVAVTVERRFATGHIDPVQRVLLRPAGRTAGPVGFSLYDDDVDVSARDLVVAMLTLSDNAAADALLGLVGLSACNETAAALGLSDTYMAADMATTIDSFGHAAGFASWSELLAAAAAASAEEHAALDAAVEGAPALHPATGTRTTARDMCRLLRAIWADEAAAPESCARLRRILRQQLTRDRLASGFAPPVSVAAKSGGLLGVIRNESGVVEYPDGDRYFVSVFTRRLSASVVPAEVNACIGRAAAVAVEMLRSDSRPYR